MELMSPAGNFKSFLEAVTNGADSVYLGLKQFNARRPAENFSIYQLRKALKIAQEEGKKVYLTLNIDLKSNELKEAAAMLELAEMLDIDAVIVKDPALIFLMNQFHPKAFSVHFSTQCSADSSFGVKFIKLLGAARVILARELTIDELKEASSINGIDTEIFVEGSMCFSISGRCLMSSWVGGRSGNRGVCTAPCRVLWDKDGKKENFFSMKDLSLIRYLDEIEKTGVKALKIEGRLKSSAWVGKVTRIYRTALDNSRNREDMDILYKELTKHSAREVGTGHFIDHDELVGKNEEWDNYRKSDDGDLTETNEEKNEVKINAAGKEFNVDIELMSKKEHLIIPTPSQPKKAKALTIDNFRNYFSVHLFKKYNIDLTINGSEFFSSSFMKKTAKEIEKKINEIIRDVESLPEIESEIIKFIAPEKKIKERKRVLGEYPERVMITPEQLNFFIDSKFQIESLVVSLENNLDIEKIKDVEENFQIILSLPSVIYEKNAKRMYKYIRELFKLGFENFEANSYTGMELLREIKCKKSLGAGMAVMNHLSARYFYKLGFNSVYVASEGDSSVYKALSTFAEGNVACLVFGQIPLFYSRVNSKNFKIGTEFVDKFGVEIECHNAGEINIFLSKMPFSLIENKIKKQNITFDTLTADLRYFKNPLNVLMSIFNDEYDEKNTSSFNFFKKLV